MSWLVLSFSAVFFFTLLGILQRTLAVESKNPRAMAIIFNSIAAFIAIIVFLLSGSLQEISLPKTIFPWLVLLIASLFYAVFERGRCVAAKLLDASVLTTISNTSVLVAFIGSLFLYSESLSFRKIMGSLLIIGALFLVSIGNQTKNKSKKGLLIGLAINIVVGLGWMLDKLGTQHFTADIYSIFIWTVPIILIYLPKIEFSEIVQEFKIASWKVFILAAVNVFGYLLQLKALELAEATKVIPIVQTYTLFTILFAVLFLNEKDHIYLKSIAGAMAFAGTYCLI